MHLRLNVNTGIIVKNGEVFKTKITIKKHAHLLKMVALLLESTSRIFHCVKGLTLHPSLPVHLGNSLLVLLNFNYYM